MKHIPHTLAIFVLAILATSCNSDERQVRHCAQKYLEATANYLVDKAIPYASEETRETTIPFMKNNLMPLVSKEYIDANTPATIVINQVLVEQDSAFVCYTKSTPIKTLNSEICLIKEGGKWLVYAPLIVPQELKFMENISIIDSLKSEKLR